jgi:ATP-dependent metalloprotease FtsH
MDDKTGHPIRPQAYKRCSQSVKTYGRKTRKFLQDQKNTLLTGFLLLLSVVLLFAIFAQLPPPVMQTAPNAMTQIDYSTFMDQVKIGNVVAVAVRGNEVEGLLKAPLAASIATPAPSEQTTHSAGSGQESLAKDVAAWSQAVRSNSTAVASALPVPSSRAVYVLLPPAGDVQLMPLLLSKNVQIITLSPDTSGAWLQALWHLVPFILTLVLMLLFFFSWNKNKANSSRSANDQFSQLGKSKARRIERSQGPNTTPSQANKSMDRSTTLAPKKAAPSARTGPVATTTAAHVVAPPDVTFADVAGIDEVRAELEEIVQFLRAPERYDRLGAHIPRGALLVGPPGTGKTLLAKAVAGEANVPFFSMSASEFVEMFVGVGASRVRDLFQQARQAAPAVIFLDEIDAVGRRRSMRMSGSEERDQTLNQLLVELDGFASRHAVVVLAATNRVDILDKALLRPGRFDRRITVSPPDRVGREAILKVHTRKTPLDALVNLERLSRMTTGMCGADLANLVNEAALSAARRDLEQVTHECFEEALARVQLGALRPLVMSEKERRIIAYHEGGHALVAYHLPEADTVNRVTILPRGQSLGVTQFTAEEDRYNYSRETLMARIAVGLGGRVAEELTFGPDRITTGAENDLQVVTDLARRMVTRWGMSERVGVVFADYRAEGDYSLNMRRMYPEDLPAQAHALALDAQGNPVFYQPRRRFAMAAPVPAPVPRSSNGGTLDAVIDAEVQCILNEGRSMARQLLMEHSSQLALLADALIEHEQLDRAQFETLLQNQSSN